MRYTLDPLPLIMTGVHFFLGPMFSGKSTALIESLRRARLGGFDCVLVSPVVDTRFPTQEGAPPEVQTHGGIVARSGPQAERLGSLRIVKSETLAGVVLQPHEKVVGIDEGQFFPDLREGLLGWQHVSVFVAALNGSFRRQPFPSVSRALPLATTIEQKTAVCMMCMGGALPVPAHFSILLEQEKSEGDVIIGGADKYMSVCQRCYVTHSAT
jgi:thymidine kinase